jgi:hypothetical protein
MKLSVLAVSVTMVAATALPVFDLRPQTLAAYERYVALTEARVARERAGAAPFLWIDAQPPATQAAAMARLRRGEVVVAPLETKDNGRTLDVPDGLVHHWVGTVLVPEMSAARLVAFVQNYDRYPEIFAPMIQRARVLERSDVDPRTVRYEVSMRTNVKKVITVVMDGTYAIDYYQLSPSRIATTNVATDLFQVHDAGSPAERREAGDEASGYLWRFRMYCAFDERPEGSVEQCESISLTRPIPFGLAWIVKPFVTGIPRETLEFTLGQVRAALVLRPMSGEPRASVTARVVSGKPLEQP